MCSRTGSSLTVSAYHGGDVLTSPLARVHILPPLPNSSTMRADGGGIKVPPNPFLITLWISVLIQIIVG